MNMAGRVLGGLLCGLVCSQALAQNEVARKYSFHWLVGENFPVGYENTLGDLIRNSNLQYPLRSLRAGEQGTCTMILGFGRDGAIKYVRITRSAGYEALDAQCRKVFWDIARFPPVPGDFSPTTPEFKFEDSFTFSLNDVQQRSK